MGNRSRRLVASALLLVGGAAAPAGSAAPASPVPVSAPASTRVDELVRQMTIEEKIDFVGGVFGFMVRGVPRLGVPRFKMADGPFGVRNFGPATAMAAGIGLAATWNSALFERVGGEIGRDARAKGVHFLLGPGVNIYRAPQCGRNFEYFGEDPFLAARAAVGYINGVQKTGVSATVKHFMGNNSEFDRHNIDTVVDERTMREIYLPTFEAAVKEAHVGAVMNSYNLTNGEHMTQNAHLNLDVLKKEWGFDGVLMSDWTATYDAVAAANAGLDLEMPFGEFMNRKNLLPAIEQKKVAVATIDDKVRRVLRTGARFGWLDREQTDSKVPRYNLAGRAVALEAARESLVLLKNDGGLLPLDPAKIKSIALIGPNAHPAVPVGGGSAAVAPFAAVSPLQGLANRFGAAVSVYNARGIPTLAEMAEATQFTTAAAGGEPGLRAEYFTEKEPGAAAAVTRTEPHLTIGRGFWYPEKSLSSRWTGYFAPPSAGVHDLFVASSGEDGGAYRLYVDDKLVLDDWTDVRAIAGQASLTLDARPHKVVLEQKGRSLWLGSWLFFGIVRHGTVVEAEAKTLAAQADVVVIAAGFTPETESEGADRTFRLPPGQEELIETMAAANKRTVVVLTAGGGSDMTTWLDSVPAVIQAWYGGQEGGIALAEVLAGDVNPSGRLPVTFERRFEDNPVHDSYYAAPGTRRVAYKEGIFVGYRGYEHNGTKPLFPFGFGLSYTTFAYENLKVEAGADRHYTVSFDVRNTGSREGAEVAQVYVGAPHAKVPRPVKELKGFAKLSLKPGESKRVSVPLDARSFSYYDVAAKRWQADPGGYDVLVGRSSQQIELRGSITLPKAKS